MKSKHIQPRLLYPAKLSFKIKGEIRSRSDKKKPKEFVNTNAVLQQMLKGLLEERRRRRRRIRRRRRRKRRRRRRRTRTRRRTRRRRERKKWREIV